MPRANRSHPARAGGTAGRWAIPAARAQNGYRHLASLGASPLAIEAPRREPGGLRVTCRRPPGLQTDTGCKKRPSRGTPPNDPWWRAGPAGISESTQGFRRSACRFRRSACRSWRSACRFGRSVGCDRGLGGLVVRACSVIGAGLAQQPAVPPARAGGLLWRGVGRGHAQKPGNLCDSQARSSRPNEHPVAKSPGAEHVPAGPGGDREWSRPTARRPRARAGGFYGGHGLRCGEGISGDRA